MLYMGMVTNLCTEIFLIWFCSEFRIHEEKLEDLLYFLKHVEMNGIHVLFQCLLILKDSHIFLDITKDSTCEKLQRKAINSTEMEL